MSGVRVGCPGGSWGVGFRWVFGSGVLVFRWVSRSGVWVFRWVSGSGVWVFRWVSRFVSGSGVWVFRGPRAARQTSPNTQHQTLHCTQAPTPDTQTPDPNTQQDTLMCLGVLLGVWIGCLGVWVGVWVCDVWVGCWGFSVFVFRTLGSRSCRLFPCVAGVQCFHMPLTRSRHGGAGRLDVEHHYCEARKNISRSTRGPQTVGGLPPRSLGPGRRRARRPPTGVCERRHAVTGPHRRPPF